MDDERLEWALRRVPGVLACSLEGDTATLLVDPHASALEVEAAANALLLDAGDARPPLVLGGSRPIVAAPRRRFDVIPVAKAAGPGIVAVGAAALVVSLVASPAAFWRDAPPSIPAEGSSQAIAPPVTGRRGPTPAPATASTVAPAAAAAPVAPVAARRLVLLVPELPAAPGLGAAATPDASDVAVLALGGAAPRSGGPAPSPLAPAETPVPVGVHSAETAPTANPRHRERAGRPRPVTSPRNLGDAVDRNDARDDATAGLDLTVRLRGSSVAGGGGR